MAKSINVLLSLKDRFTNPLNKATKATKRAEREIAAAHKTINKFANNANKKFKSVASTAAKTLGGMSIAALTAGTVAGFSEAFNLETYQAQLETATGDTKKAAEIMKYAIDMANKTPFEGGQLVEAAAKFEAMGMSSEYWLTKAGDMAGATGKDIMQATEALIDAQSGEWERMKEFGIKGVKDMDTLVSIMDTRFAGGMDKLANTTKGIWSTVTGVTKNALANIVGVMNDGTIKAGSPIDLLRTKLQGLADKLTQWQADGTVEKISNTLTEVLGKALDKVGKVMSWVKDNANWLMPVLGGLLATFTAFNIITKISNGITSALTVYHTVVKGVTAAQGAFNFIMSANPLGMVAIAIGAVVVAGIALYKNWDTVKAKAQELWDKVKEVGEGIKEALTAPFEAVKEAISPIVEWLGGKFDWIKEKVSNIPIIGGVVEKIKSRKQNIDGNATGTAYFHGGLTRINEGGRGEIVNLPNGSQIIPHSLSKQQLQKNNNVTINLTVQGNVIGNEAYANYMGQFITKKVVAALNNM